MPIYEYQCPACEHAFEKLVKMGAEPPPCPECGGVEVVKKVSAAGFILKGGGWYKDHYGLKSGGKADAAAKSEGGASDGGAKADSGAKSDGGSKPEGGAAKAEGTKASPAQKAAAKSTATP